VNEDMIQMGLLVADKLKKVLVLKRLGHAHIDFSSNPHDQSRSGKKPIVTMIHHGLDLARGAALS
jgi:hypothetical protein